MACDATTMTEYLRELDGLDPINAVICPFAQSADGGLGLGIPLTMLLIGGPIGLALTVRTQHPGPIVVAGMLTVGTFAATIPGQASQIAAIVFLFALVAVGFFLYRTVKGGL